MKLLRRRKKRQKTETIPTIGGYVFWHTRGNEVVLIGSFATLDEAREWYSNHGNRLGVQPALTHMRFPADNYNALWGLMPEETNL